MLLRSYCHAHAHTTTPVHDDGSFFDDAVGPNHDGSRNGKNSRLGMYDGPRADSDVAFELNILAYHSLRVNCEFISAGRIVSKQYFKEMYFEAHIGGMHSAYPVQ
jgi:hypothetical protein